MMTAIALSIIAVSLLQQASGQQKISQSPLIIKERKFPKRIGRIVHLITQANAGSLPLLVFSSEIIVVGTIEGVVRYGHTPLNSQAADQHTLFALRVQETLKGPHEPWRKIYEVGGPLPWREGGISGIGMRVADSPPLIIGKTYLLFLRGNSDNMQMRMFGHSSVEAKDGTMGIAQYADEFQVNDYFFGKLLLKDGKAASPDPENRRPYRFGSKPEHEPIGRSWSEVLGMVRELVALYAR